MQKGWFGHLMLTILRWSLSVLWRLFTVGGLLVITTNNLARGITYQAPDWGTRLSKSPGWAWLAQWKETQGITQAFVGAAIMMVVSLVMYEIVMWVMAGEDLFARFKNPERMRKLAISLASVFIAVETWFYFSGILAGSHTRAVFTWGALFSTIGFIGVNLAATFVSVLLSPKTQVEKESAKTPAA